MRPKTGCIAFALLTTLVVFSQSVADESSSSSPADRKTYLDGVRELLTKEWPANRTVQIVCHGHSVPSGYFATPIVDTFNAYPHLLHQRIKAAYPYAVVNVVVTAIGGEDSEAGAKRFAQDVLPLRPDVVTIDYGLNDRRIGLERARLAWTGMIKQAKAAKAKVILLTPTGHLRSKSADPSDPLNQHAAQIRHLAAEHHVGLVDSLALFQTYVVKGGKLEDLMSQVNHPNRNGHEIVADALLPWFAK